MMDRRTWLAIAICFLIFVGWQKLYLEPFQEQQRVAQQNAASPPKANGKAAAVAGSAGNVPSLESRKESEGLRPKLEGSQKPEKSVTLDWGSSNITASSSNLFFSNWQLADYSIGRLKDEVPVDLTSVTLSSGQGQFLVDAPEYSYLARIRGEVSKEGNEIFWTYEDKNVRIKRSLRFLPDQPFAQALVEAEFKTLRPKNAFITMSAAASDDDPEKVDRQLVYWSDNAINRIPIEEGIERTQSVASARWAGVLSRYFTLAFVAQEGLQPKAVVEPMKAGIAGQSKGMIALRYPIPENGRIAIPLRVYFGPKNLDLLKKVDLTLEEAVDLGWFAVVARPLLWVMQRFYAFAGNYGIAIILLTLLVKVLTYPLTYKSMKSMKEMAKIQPQIQKLRDKYKDDREALNREMLVLMRTHGYNPLAGCLPILIQMPVFIALYKVLYSAVELYQAPFMLWIQDLSAKDPYYVTPILLTVTMYVQQKLTPTTAADPTQQKVMQFMPVMFGLLMLNLPSGLTLYMLTNAVAGIFQQLILNKKLNISHGGSQAVKA